MQIDFIKIICILFKSIPYHNHNCFIIYVFKQKNQPVFFHNLQCSQNYNEFLIESILTQKKVVKYKQLKK